MRIFPLGWIYMMKKDTNTMINLDVKSNLAKLLATENITIQHNNVQTASFDVKNRVLTLPIFKKKSGDVYDMLIAHECAHALYTPYEEWEGITDKELRSYVNVLEDTRIDKLIQKKYPGVVKNYENGFTILEKQGFFGIQGKDINKDLMIIDKINLRSKSLNRLPFVFAPLDNEWLAKVDALKTFKDVLTLAKEMLEWQKDQVEQMKKLPEFDEINIVKAYNLGNDDDDFDDDDGNQEDSDTQGAGDNSDADENDDVSNDEKNDFNNFGDQKADDEKDSDKNGQGSNSNEATKEKDDSKGEATHHAKGAGGDHKPKILKSITDDSYTQKQESLLDDKNKGYRYGKMPKPNLKDGALVSFKSWLKDMNDYRIKQRQYNDIKKYDTYLDTQYKKFMNENKKTVMYLVKEFEMKKSAQAYKRASQDKTGIIDPLKLPSYKYSDDIFKKLTIIPDGKNHGMMMLLDWSGSMSDVLMNTVKQLINLVEFTRKVNIPFEVYFFTSERDYDRKSDFSGFKYKTGDWMFEDFHLVNCISHRMNRKQLDLALKTMYHMALYFDSNYSYRYRNLDFDKYNALSDSYGVPSRYYLGNTPLNESLLYMNKMIPMFRKKYDIEKMTFITLTDGSGNYPSRGRYNVARGERDYDTSNVYEIDGKKFVTRHSNITSDLLNHIKVKHDVNNIGFYVIKRVRRWDLERHVGDYKDYQDKIVKVNKMRKELTQNKAVVVDNTGYNKYFILDGKKLEVQNFDLENAQVKKGTTGELKRIFGKSMANRLVSRVVLNKFIQEVA